MMEELEKAKAGVVAATADLIAVWFSLRHAIGIARYHLWNHWTGRAAIDHEHLESVLKCLDTDAHCNLVNEWVEWDKRMKRRRELGLKVRS